MVMIFCRAGLVAVSMDDQSPSSCVASPSTCSTRLWAACAALLLKDMLFSHHVPTLTPSPAAKRAAAAPNSGVFSFHIFSRRILAGNSELLIFDAPIAWIARP